MTASDAEGAAYGTVTFVFTVPADAADGAEVAVTVSGEVPLGQHPSPE